MKWFEGSIPEAINLAKQRGSLFVVYIYGTDELSQKMTTTLDSKGVEQVLESNGAVALKILSTSQECTFFSQIYPVVVVPSVFCIGDEGVPLEVIGGYVTEEDCVQKLQDVQQTHTARKVAAPTGPLQPPAQQQQQQQQPQMDISPPDPQPSTSSDVEMTPAEQTEGATGGGDPALTITDKVEKAKELMEKVKEKKTQEEFEKSRNLEIERRKMGQDLLKLKQGQQETQMKEMREQLKKDKEEERRAKEMVKAQIARDREERAARYKKEKEDRDKSMEEAKQAKLMEQQRLAAEQEALRCETARIQVRLPDGSSMTQNFDATDTFQSLRNVISQMHLLQSVGGSVSISTTYPKRIFTEEDNDKSFQELQLAPSAVVMALPSRGGRVAGPVSSQQSSGGLLVMLMSPLWWLWEFVYSLFFGSGRGRSTESPTPQQPSQSADSAANTSSRSNRPTSAYQRRSGVRRLGDLRGDDDEDMSTYNGNSTQQL